MKIKHLFVLPILLFTANAFADDWGFKIAGGTWDHEASGSFRDTGTINIDLKDDLSLADNNEGYFYVEIEHSIPFIPNFIFTSTKLDHTGTGTLTQTFTYGGRSFTVSDSVTSQLNLDHTDITLYWQLLDNVVEFDLGLTARQLDGVATITSSAGSGTETLDEIIPMLYAKVGFELPIGFSIHGSANIISAAGSTYSDYIAKVVYKSEFNFGIEAGVRQTNLELDDVDNIFADLEFSGPFAALFLHF